jgi:hypothetical protein
MKSLSRSSGLLLASTAAAAGLSIIAPSATHADMMAAVATSAASSSTAEPPHDCEPAHSGRDWRWHDTGDGGHWDRWEWDKWHRVGEWKHYPRDNQYCEQGAE